MNKNIYNFLLFFILSCFGQISAQIDLELDKSIKVGSIYLEGASNDYNANTSTVSIAFQPQFGTVSINNDGTFNYVPNPGVVPPISDTFTYLVCNQNDPADCQQVENDVQIGDGNDFFACEDLYVVPRYTAGQQPVYELDVLLNDVNEDPNSLSIVLFPVGGTGTVYVQNGKIFFEPNQFYQGVVEFLYTVNSAVDGSSGQNKVNIVVGTPNDLVTVRDCRYAQPGADVLLEEEVCYQIAVWNDGANDATGVTVQDQLPNGLNYTGSTASQGSYSNNTSNWTVGTIAPGDTAVLNINVSPGNAGSFTNTAQVTAAGQNDNDSSPNNDNGDQSEDDEDAVGLFVINLGCTDQCSPNYSPQANVDDGSCEFYNTTCNTNCSAGDIQEWNPATCSCETTIVTVEGCTSSNACNYNPSANCNDGSCVFEIVCDTNPCTNGGVFAWDSNNCACELAEATLEGCTDATACNFDANANCDDGSCDFPIAACPEPCNAVQGCTDPEALNYNPAANCDNGSCQNPPITYVLSDLGDNCYEVSLISDITWNGAERITATAQVTLLVPTGTFSITNLQSINGNWSNNSTVIAPSENPGFDYISIGLTSLGTTDINYQTGTEESLFSFCNTGCSETITLMEPDDPFTAPNSQGINVGNQITTLGSGNVNAWKGNQGSISNVCTPGCTDPLACNYDPTAAVDDDSCILETACDTDVCTNGGAFVWDNNTCECVLEEATISGCTDATACNFDPAANCDDSSCTFAPCNPGCTDPCAPNFDATADGDDGSCQAYDSTCNSDCTAGDLTVWNAATCSCEIDVVTVLGCTDPTAVNYNNNANCDDNSCVFTIEGCTDACAPNYNPDADSDDGSCQPYNTTCNSECTDGDLTVWNAATCSCEVDVVSVLGCTDATACNYDPAANCEDSSCTFAPCNPGCTDPCAPNFDATADGDDGSCQPYNSTCNSDCTLGDLTIWNPATCSCEVDLTIVQGCTDATACNFDAAANCDDNSCTFAPCNPGCTDPCAPNFDATADGEDGSCEVYNTTCNSECALGDLTVWNAATCSCEIDVIVFQGCTDPLACNYDVNANCDDDSCVLIDAGTISTTDETTVCSGDGQDAIVAVTPSGNAGPSYTYIITDGTATTILGSNDTGSFNLEGAPAGTCLIWGIAYETINIPTNLVADITGCYELSNSVAVVREMAGCTDATACNYDSEAACDDGSCTFAPCNAGCTDPCAPNYDATADGDDGSCEPYNSTCNSDCTLGDLTVWNPTTCSCEIDVAIIQGCTDPAACNYNATANCNDDSCVLIAAGLISTTDETTVCSGDGEDAIVAVTVTGNAGPSYTYIITDGTATTILGSNDTGSFNLEGAPAGTCLIWGVAYETIALPATDLVADITGCFELSNSVAVVRETAGCTDATACNYDAAAGCDDGSCTFAPCDGDGCTIPVACNYDPNATNDDGSCIVLLAGIITTNSETTVCTGDGQDAIVNVANIGNMGPSYTFIITDETATTILGSNQTGTFNLEGAPAGTCLIWGIAHDDLNIPTDQVADLTGCFELTNSIAVVREAAGCTDATACNYDAAAGCDDGSCTFAPCDGDGCTDPTACNYDAAATNDDGSCILLDGGTISTTDETTVCSGDGEDAIVAVTVTGNAGPSYTYIITDGTATTILGSNDTGSFNLEGAPAGTCLIWGVAYETIALPATDLVADITGCFELSNSVAVVRETAGCTDATACNYDAAAGCDDGSCTFAPCAPGCTDPCAANFDASADEDDGSCEAYDMTCNTDCALGDITVWDANTCSCIVETATSLGCTDATACNYNPFANCDNGSCEFVGCAGGCTDPCAPNYDATADVNDGSCELYDSICNDDCTLGDITEWNAATCSCELVSESIAGCTLPDACNYDAAANCDDGSCAFAPCNPGCTDPCAANFDSNADENDGSCEAYDSTCNDDCTLGAITEWNPVSCSCEVVEESILGCTNIDACNFDPAATCNDGTCTFAPCAPGCTDPCASNYDPDAIENDGSCLAYDTSCNTDCTVGDLEEWNATTCSCEVSEATVSGCTNSQACNYDPAANCDDDSCFFTDCVPGCTDPCAANYDSAAQSDDGTCEAYDATCNQDCSLGNIQIWDAETCACVDDVISVLGCNDLTACNYDPAANCDDGSCTFAPCNPGCTDACAPNYDPTAESDDGSCVAYNDFCNTDCENGPITVWDTSTCSCIPDPVNPCNALAEICGDFEVIHAALCSPSKEEYDVLLTFDGNGEYIITNNVNGSVIGPLSLFNLTIGPFDVGTGYSFTVELAGLPECAIEFGQTLIDCQTTNVEMLRFDGEVLAEGNELNWATATEEDAKYFILEHSLNGYDFSEIAEIDAVGNSNTIQSYNYLHNTKASGIHYYRLLEVDVFGNIATRTRVISLERTAVFGITEIYPIPAVDVLNIEFDAEEAEEFEMTIMDVTGKEMAKTTIQANQGQNLIKLDVQAYPSGYYLIKLSNGRNTLVEKFINN